MPEFRTAGFHHITMVSGDARRTLRFYRDLLGLGLIKRTVNFDDPGAWHLYFGDPQGTPGTLLTFFEWPRTPRGQWGLGSVHHLALGVETPDAQLMWKRRLQDHDVPVAGPYNRGYFRSIYFRDPDGQVLEIATRGPGYALDEPADALGLKVLTPPGAELVGGRDELEIESRNHPEPVPDILPEMALQGIHHITGITGDIEQAHDFYTEMLGLRRVKMSVNQDDPDTPHHFWAAYDGRTVAPHSTFTLFGWRPDAPGGREGRGLTHHIAFRAADAQQQLAWREHLLERGVKVTEVKDRLYFQSIYFRAPDGQLLEIATDGPGFGVDEDLTVLGEKLQLPAWLAPRRREIADALSDIDGNNG